MSEFVDAALAFPTVLFTFLLIVVIGYWLLVLAGGLGVDALDADVDLDVDLDMDVDSGTDANEAGFAGFLGGLGLGGVPVTVVLSLLIALAWFACLTGTALLADADLAAPVTAALSVGLLVVGVLAAWLGTRVVIHPLRRLFPNAEAASRRDFVGRACVIRTGRVDETFGQAEVTASDGSTAVVQVRASADGATLRSGELALIYEYDGDGEFFLVSPLDPSLDPHT